MMKDFGLRLENLREKCGYMKYEVSEKLGFTANVYGSYEREERRPTMETLIQLADLYNVSLDYLIRGKEYTRDQNKNVEILQELITYFEELEMKEPYILEIEKWKSLSKADIKELTNHFEWIVTRAKQ